MPTTPPHTSFFPLLFHSRLNLITRTQTQSNEYHFSVGRNGLGGGATPSATPGSVMGSAMGGGEGGTKW